MNLVQPADYIYLGLNLITSVLLGWVLWTVLRRYRKAKLQFTLILGVLALILLLHEVTSLVTVATEPDFIPSIQFLFRNILDVAAVGLLLYLVTR